VYEQQTEHFDIAHFAVGHDNAVFEQRSFAEAEDYT